METSADAIENGGASTEYSEAYPKPRDSAAQKLSSCNCGGWGGFGGCGLLGFELGSQASPGGHQDGLSVLPPPPLRPPIKIRNGFKAPRLLGSPLRPGTSVPVVVGLRSMVHEIENSPH